MRECTPDNHLRVVNLPPDPAVAQINRWSASSTYAEGTLKKQISRRQASAHNHAAAYSHQGRIFVRPLRWPRKRLNSGLCLFLIATAATCDTGV